MDNFFVITNKPKDPGLETTSFICSYLEKNHKKCTVVIRETLEKKLASEQENPLEIPEDTDCVLVLGGDGTLLQTARDTVHLDIPLVGINLGTLGYMAEVEKSNLQDALDRILRDEGFVEQRMMLAGNISSAKSGEIAGYALNDIVFCRQGELKVIAYDIYVNGQFLNRYEADGLIVSTPTGSTGYNLSAGGPIVEPKARLILITPICPHTLNSRSIILSPDDQIEVRIAPGHHGTVHNVFVSFDGSLNEELTTGDSVFITQSDKNIRFYRLNQVSFLEVLHKKMSEK